MKHLRKKKRRALTEHLRNTYETLMKHLWNAYDNWWTHAWNTHDVQQMLVPHECYCNPCYWCYALGCHHTLTCTSPLSKESSTQRTNATACILQSVPAHPTKIFCPATCHRSVHNTSAHTPVAREAFATRSGGYLWLGVPTELDTHNYVFLRWMSAHTLGLCSCMLVFVTTKPGRPFKVSNIN